MDRKKKIDVNSSSLVGLKAELYRKQEEFKKERLERSSGSLPTGTKPKKASSIWSKKKHQSFGVSQPKKDVEQQEKERLEIDRARSMLEAKTRLYEQITSGNDIPDEQTNNLFLVDFERKQLDKVAKADAGSSKQDSDEDILAPESDIPLPSTPDEEWVDYTDTLGRSRRCMKKDLPKLLDMDKRLNPDKFKPDPKQDTTDDVAPELMSDDMHRERMRKKWEQEQEDLIARGQSSIHYQNVRFDEVRTHGVAYFEFAKDQETRDKQMDTLKLLRDETVNQRIKREDLKAKRKAALEARLEKVRQRKKIKTGVPEDLDYGANQQTMEGSGSEANVGALESPGVTGHKEEKEAEAVDPNWQRTLRLLEAAKKESAKADREWDVAKEPKAWADHRARIKNERPAEFAPPTDYTPSVGRKKDRKRWLDQGRERGDPSPATPDSSSTGEIHSVLQTAYGGTRVGDGQWSKEAGVKSMEGPRQAPANRGHQPSSSERYLDGLQSPASDEHRTAGMDVKTSMTAYGSSSFGGSGDQQSKEPRDRVYPLSGDSMHIEPSSEQPDHEGNSLSKCNRASLIGNYDSAGPKRSDNVTPDGVEEASSEHKPTALIRAEGSKPIKFSLGGGRKSDKGLLGTANFLEDDDIRKGLRSLRQGEIS